MALTQAQKDFINKIGEMATVDMKNTGILASLTIVQAILESGWGTSGLTIKANALFGIKASATWKGKVYNADTKECYDGVHFTTINAAFRAYDSWQDSINDHSALFTTLPRYSAIIGEKDYKKACNAVQAAGYATDPGYANKLIALIETHNLFEFDGTKGATTMSNTVVNTTAVTGKTNIGLVAHARKALAEKWYYFWGAIGQKVTLAAINDKINQYPAEEKWRSYITPAIGKTRMCDCYGLVKGFLWWTDDNGNPGYNKTQDKTANQAYTTATEKGPLNTMPEIPGLVLWKDGHAGVYCGNGEFIELRGSGTGAVAGKISNGQIVSGSKFTHWFKDVNIKYEGGVVSTPTTTFPYKVKITATELNIRTGPGTNYEKLSSIKMNDTLTVIKEGVDSKGTRWGQVKGGGWISLDYASKI